MGMKIPEGWAVSVRLPSWVFGTFGWTHQNQQLIEIYPPKWIPSWGGLRDWWVKKTIEHELGHAWGIKGCKKPWCLMFESEELWPGHKEAWWEELLSVPFRLLYRFRFCKEHRRYLEQKGAL